MFLPLSDNQLRTRAPVVTVAIIAANVVAFLALVALAPAEQRALIHAWGATPAHVLADGAVWTLVTSMFVHGSVLHLAGNMWFLWVFGSRLENAMGAWRYAVFYLGTGLAAAALQLGLQPDSLLPMIGASGAIAGVLGGYAWRFPRARVRCLVFLFVFVTTVWVPAPLLLGVWFLGQFVSAGGGEPGVAWFAHIGGFLAGLGAVHWFAPRPRPVLPPTGWVVYPRQL